MDLSALIFVALAVAWAAYLIPKALKHHDEVVRSRSVERFSSTMRVLARREPVDARSARLVVTPDRRPTTTEVVVKPSARLSRAQLAARRRAAQVAARRRRRVLGTLLLALGVVGALAAFAVVHPGWLGVPGGLVVAWLVACRVMVKGERAALAPARRRVAVEVGEPDLPIPMVDPLTGELVLDPDAVLDDGTQEIAVVAADPADPTQPARPGMWDPVPVTLPTYVGKEHAARSVRTIDLDSTGVWSSGRNDEDSRLAREADAAAADQRRAASASEDEPRATGS